VGREKVLEMPRGGKKAREQSRGSSLRTHGGKEKGNFVPGVLRKGNVQVLSRGGGITPVGGGWIGQATKKKKLATGDSQKGGRAKKLGGAEICGGEANARWGKQGGKSFPKKRQGLRLSNSPEKFFDL